jgi:hypothetical protein
VLPSDLNGAHGNLKLNYWNGSSWIQLFGTVGAAPSLTFAGGTEITAPLGGNDYTGRVNPAVPFVWQPNDGNAYDFNDPLNWLPNRVAPSPIDELHFTNGGSSTAYGVPTQTIKQLIVQSNTDITFEAQTGGARTLTVAGDASTTNIVVASGSTLQMGGTTQLSITMTGNANQAADISGTWNINNNGTANNTLTVNGVASNVFTVAATGVINNNGGLITSSSNVSNLVFAGTGTYNHNMNGGAIPSSAQSPFATWGATSNCNITGITTLNPSPFRGTFGNLTWNNSGQTSATGAVSWAVTVAGDLTVNAGTLYDNGQIITGNASGAFSVSNGATYRTFRSTTLPLLPTFPGANVSLAPTSTIMFAGTTAHTIPNNPTSSGTMTNYGILGIEGTVTKTLTTPVSVDGINISTASSWCVLNDGGNKISGPGSGSGTFNMAASSVFTTSTTDANPMPVMQTYTIAPTAVVNFNALASAQNIYNVSSPGYGIINVITNGGVKSLIGTTYAQGTITVNAAAQNTTLNLNGHTLASTAATPLTMATASVFTGNASRINHTLAMVTRHLPSHIAATTITGGKLANLISSNTNASGVLLGNFNNAGTVWTIDNLTINAGATFTINAENTES